MLLPRHPGSAWQQAMHRSCSAHHDPLLLCPGLAYVCTRGMQCWLNLDLCQAAVANCTKCTPESTCDPNSCEAGYYYSSDTGSVGLGPPTPL